MEKRGQTISEEQIKKQKTHSLKSKSTLMKSQKNPISANALFEEFRNGHNKVVPDRTKMEELWSGIEKFVPFISTKFYIIYE